MLPQKNNIFRVVASFIFCAVLITGAMLILLFKQSIIDQIIVWQFSPTSEVASLASRVSLSDNGQFLFYASQPELNSSNDFNNVCNRIENTNSILGCYSNFRIYIYNVTDVKLDGIREVTAAHEMLHAAYQRMSYNDKIRIDALLEAEYDNLENDRTFVELIDFYSRTEPGERGNELHSVIGTTAHIISPELEAHYGKYFSNRQSVVALNDKYNDVFQVLDNRQKLLSKQLAELAVSIPDRSSQYNLDVQKLNSDIIIFNRKAENNNFVSQSEFNAERSELETRIVNIDAARDAINSDIDNYNLILVEYNSIASESKKLYNSMDSTLVEVPSV